ncbi:MAG: hypothetical protein GY811_25305 [Myxococcales bacterium]|nr:hypothetical protein [Myxococcales bacterium]
MTAGGRHTCALDAAGAVSCWGNDYDGQSTQVPDALGKVVQVTAGGGHTCALDDAGAVSCWGDDQNGQSTVPDGLGTVVQVTAGGRDALRIWAGARCGGLSGGGDGGSAPHVRSG